MSRIEKHITGTLRLKTAMHIGIGKAHEPTDAPLRRASNGEIFIPGRALGGVLRSTATLLAPRIKNADACRALKNEKSLFDKPCHCPVCKLFGDLAPGTEDKITRARKQEYEEDASPNENGEKTAASRLWIEDAQLLSQDDQPKTLIRDGVGISRSTGAAYQHAKFDHEIMPAGTAFSLRMRWVEDFNENDEEEKASVTLREHILAAVLAEWKEGRGYIGANKARGLGRFAIEDVKLKTLALQNADQLVEYLLEDHPESAENKAWLPVKSDWIENLLPPNDSGALRRNLKEWSPHSARNFVVLLGELSFDGPFLSNDPMVAALSGFDHAPMLDCVWDEAGRPIISGASLRGALRSHAEKIARTLAMPKIDLPLNQQKYETARKEFLRKCPACDPLAQQKNEKLPLANCDSRWREKEKKEKKEEQILSENDLCLSCRLFGSARLGSRFLVEDATWPNGVPLNDKSWKAQDFLAIDRFTGGGLEGAKFDAAPLIQPKFNLRLQLTNAQDWEIGWLALVLRDLKDGIITFGFGAAKGYGRATIANLSWEIGYIDEADLQIEDLKNIKPAESKSVYSGLYTVITGRQGENDAAWLKILNKGVEAFHAMLKKFELEEEVLRFEKDSYFNHDNLEESLLWLYHVNEAE